MSPRMLVFIPLLLGYWGAASGDALCHLRVIVHEAVQGRPLNDRAVYFLSDADGGLMTSRTDHVGAAVFEDLTCGPGRVGLGFIIQGTSASPSGLRLGQPVVLMPGSNPEVRLVVPDLAEIRVIANSQRDDPVAGVSVALRPSSTLGGPSDPFPVVTSTDSAGVASVTLVANQRYVLRVVSGPLGQIVRLAVDGHEVQNGQEVSIGSGNSVLEIAIDGESELKGVVLAEGDIKGPQTVLDLFPVDAGPCHGCVQVDESGAFSFEVTSLPVRVRPRSRTGNWEYEPREIEVTRETADALLAFSAKRRGGDDVVFRLHGLENELSREAVHPTVTWSCEEGTGGLRPKVDAGSFRVPCLERCDYRVEVPQFGRFRATKWNGTTDTCPAAFDLTLEAGWVVKGRVTDEGGEGLSGVALLASRGTEYASTVTNESGDFTFEGVSEGVYEVALNTRKSESSDSYAVLVDEAGEIPQLEAVEDPEEPEKVRLQVVRGGEVCASLNDVDGYLLKYSVLRASDSKPAASRVVRVPYGGASDRICLGGLPSGKYQIKVGDSTDGLLPVWYPGEYLEDMAGWIDVEAGRTVDIGPLATHRTGSVKLRVSDRDRDLLQSMKIVAVCRERSGFVTGSSECVEAPIQDKGLRANDAEIELSGVPVGEWFLFLSARDSSCRDSCFASTESVVVPGGGGVDVVKVSDSAAASPDSSP